MSCPNRHTIAALASLAAGLLVAPAPARVAGTPASSPPAIEQKAKERVDRATAAYNKLSSLSETIDCIAIGVPLPATHCLLRFKRPNRISIKNSMKGRETAAVSNASGVFASKSVDKSSYLKIPPPADAHERWQDVATAAEGLGLGPTGLFLAGGPALPPNLASLKVGPDAQVADTPVESVAGTLRTASGTMAFTFAFGKADHLLRKVTIKTPAGLLTETHSEIKIDPELPASTFAFTPPAGATPVDPTAEPVTYDPRLKPGARPFPFSAKDRSGNPISLDQYHGKVVLLDFWATWCGPCLSELPNVIAAYKQFKDQGFDILGVSLDQTASALSGFLKSHDMPWRQAFDGKGWMNAVAVQYRVQGIPFSLLIGKDGTIQEVSPRGALLAPAIRKALAKK